MVAQAVYDFFHETRNIALIDDLRALGLRMTEPVDRRQPRSDAFAGKTVVLTGRLERFTRDQAQDLLRKAGATVTSSVSRKTDFVIAGEDAGSKADRAREIGVTTIWTKPPSSRCSAPTWQRAIAEVISDDDSANS